MKNIYNFIAHPFFSLHNFGIYKVYSMPESIIALILSYISAIFLLFMNVKFLSLFWYWGIFIFWQAVVYVFNVHIFKIVKEDRFADKDNLSAKYIVFRLIIIGAVLVILHISFVNLYN